MADYDTYSPEVGLYNDMGHIPVINPGAPTTTRRRRLEAGTPAESGTGGSVKNSNSAARSRKSTSAARTSKSKDAQMSMDERIIAFFHNPMLRVFTGLFLLLLGAYLLICLISYTSSCFTDQAYLSGVEVTHGARQVSNYGGQGGAVLSDTLVNDGFGIGALVIIFWLEMMALKLLTNSRLGRFKTVNFTIKCLIALITVSLIIGLMTIGLDVPFNLGGAHGRYVNQAIIDYIGWAGAGLLCIFMLSLFVGICLNDVVQWILRKKRQRDALRAERRAQQEAAEARKREMDEMMRQDIIEDTNAGEHVDILTNVSDNAEGKSAAQAVNMNFENPGADGIDNAPAEESMTYVYDEDMEVGTDNLLQEKSNDEIAPLSADTAEKEPESESESAQSQDDGMVMTVNVNHIDTVDESETPQQRENEVYHFPPVELLAPPKEQPAVDSDEQVRNKELIRKTLLDFGIPITQISATVGPTVTLYEIIPEPGIKISSIRSRDEDIARSLSAFGVRIIAPMPGRGTVGIEVPNRDAHIVAMRTVITSRKYRECEYELPIALGSTISNEVFITDLAKMPHLLVAGATGQGKSVGLNAMITSLLYRKYPSELKFVMFDPKKVELNLYSILENHYLAKLPGEDDAIITDVQEKTLPVLNSLCVEMSDRYELLKAARVRDIKSYNEKFNNGQIGPINGNRFLPYIIVVIDEYADLVMTAGKEIEKPIARLAQMGRAVGIHLIVATQRPSTDVVTGMIKANFPARMAFRVSSGVDSKTILNSTAAQKLIGRGDMLVSVGLDLERVQCALVETPEVEKICHFISQQPGGEGVYLLPDPPAGNEKDDGFGLDDNQPVDPLLGDVARQIANLEQASTSGVQRRFNIGYNRAGRIMDQLERMGVVGPSHGGKPRAVLVDPQTLESILQTVGQ